MFSIFFNSRGNHYGWQEGTEIYTSASFSQSSLSGQHLALSVVRSFLFYLIVDPLWANSLTAFLAYTSEILILWIHSIATLFCFCLRQRPCYSSCFIQIVESHFNFIVAKITVMYHSTQILKQFSLNSSVHSKYLVSTSVTSFIAV